MKNETLLPFPDLLVTKRLDRHEPGRRPRRIDRRQQADDDSQNRHDGAIDGFDFERDVRDGIDFGRDRNQVIMIGQPTQAEAEQQPRGRSGQADDQPL